MLLFKIIQVQETIGLHVTHIIFWVPLAFSMQINMLLFVQSTTRSWAVSDKEATERALWRSAEGVCFWGPRLLWGSGRQHQLSHQPGETMYSETHAVQPQGDTRRHAGQDQLPRGTSYRWVSTELTLYMFKYFCKDCGDQRFFFNLKSS